MATKVNSIQRAAGRLRFVVVLQLKLQKSLRAAAVHGDRRAVDGTGALGCQERYQRGQFFRAREAADGHVRGGLLQDLVVGDACILCALFEKLGEAIGERVAGADIVDGDAIGAEFIGERLGHSRDAGPQGIR